MLSITAEAWQYPLIQCIAVHSSIYVLSAKYLISLEQIQDRCISPQRHATEGGLPQAATHVAKGSVPLVTGARLWVFLAVLGLLGLLRLLRLYLGSICLRQQAAIL